MSDNNKDNDDDNSNNDDVNDFFEDGGLVEISDEIAKETETLQMDKNELNNSPSINLNTTSSSSNNNNSSNAKNSSNNHDS